VEIRTMVADCYKNRSRVEVSWSLTSRRAGEGLGVMSPAQERRKVVLAGAGGVAHGRSDRGGGCVVFVTDDVEEGTEERVVVWWLIGHEGWWDGGIAEHRRW
jgi:hypothetical protein